MLLAKLLIFASWSLGPTRPLCSRIGAAEQKARETETGPSQRKTLHGNKTRQTNLNRHFHVAKGQHRRAARCGAAHELIL